MRIVVTGASGFLGQALLRHLSREDVEVLGVARREQPGLVQVATYADSPGGDVLIHLAEASDRRWANEQGAPYEEAVLGTLEALFGNGYRRIVYASTALLYGDQNDSLRRVDDPVHVVDSYTHLKYATEQAVLKRGGVVARLTNLIGPGMSGSNVLSAILKQLPLAGPLSLLDVTPVRDFLWIEDAAAAMAMMAMGKPSGIFNVGSGVRTSILDLAHLALDAAGQAGRPVESKHYSTKRSQLVVDIAETTATFGWRPMTTLYDGIEKLVSKPGTLVHTTGK